MTKSQQQPVVRRAASQRSTRNAAAILKAITQECIANGLDGIVASSVAKRAGLTTGAVYSRFENSDEMLIALWENVVAPEFQTFVVDTQRRAASPPQAGTSTVTTSRLPAASLNSASSCLALP